VLPALHVFVVKKRHGAALLEPLFLRSCLSRLPPLWSPSAAAARLTTAARWSRGRLCCSRPRSLCSVGRALSVGLLSEFMPRAPSLLLDSLRLPRLVLTTSGWVLLAEAPRAPSLPFDSLRLLLAVLTMSGGVLLVEAPALRTTWSGRPEDAVVGGGGCPAETIGVDALMGRLVSVPNPACAGKGGGAAGVLWSKRCAATTSSRSASTFRRAANSAAASTALLASARRASSACRSAVRARICCFCCPRSSGPVAICRRSMGAWLGCGPVGGPCVGCDWWRCAWNGRGVGPGVCGYACGGHCDGIKTGRASGSIGSEECIPHSLRTPCASGLIARTTMQALWIWAQHGSPCGFWRSFTMKAACSSLRRLIPACGVVGECCGGARWPMCSVWVCVCGRVFVSAMCRVLGGRVLGGEALGGSELCGLVLGGLVLGGMVLGGT